VGDNAERDVVQRRDAEPTQADAEPFGATLGHAKRRKGDAKVGAGSPKCQKVSKGKSQVFSFSFSIKSFLVKEIAAKDY